MYSIITYPCYVLPSYSKTHTMKKMKEEYDLQCIEFRKWMIEQRKKTKKDPLPQAKVEVSKVHTSQTLPYPTLPYP